MKLEVYCPAWGSEALPFEDFVSRVKDAGYDGIEAFLSPDDPEAGKKADLIKSAELSLIAQHAALDAPDPEEHKVQLRRRLQFLAELQPKFISSQTGRDFFEFEDNLELISIANEVSEKNDVTIYHETHRSKMTFAAHITRRFLEKVPDMRLTLDISHWFCVHERFLEEQHDAVNLALDRTEHFHARVGHDQGSQVPDFRKPEWEEVLNIHLGIWDEIVRRSIARGKETITVTPEFGPYPYMLTYPGTNKPMADQWEMNVDMMNLLSRRWESRV